MLMIIIGNHRDGDLNNESEIVNRLRNLIYLKYIFYSLCFIYYHYYNKYTFKVIL